LGNDPAYNEKCAANMRLKANIEATVAKII